MRCLKCKGLMYVEKFKDTPDHIDVACAYCGARKFVRVRTPLGRWLSASLERIEQVWRWTMPNGREALVWFDGYEWRAKVSGKAIKSEESPA